MQEGVREIFLTRTKVLKAMRRFLDERGFMEVETPILQPIYGGASAKPFETHHLALNQKMYLRISDELYLKRLIIGGIERVYEIGKDFRNEGVSTVHNPEFTQMECYQAYADYHEMMKLTEEMIYFVAQQAIGKTQIVYQGRYIDLAPPWERVTLRDVILNRIGIDIEADLEGLSHQIKEKSLDIEGSWGEIVDGLLKEIESSLGFGKDPKNPGKPIFVMDYPVEISPLAKRKPQSEFTERFEVFVGGIELGNAFSELNDPLEQRERFSAQEELRLKGDEEAHLMDEDFIVALEHGMPPTGGLGIGVDRLVMLLVDSPSIREVMLFPQLRAKT
jgi:lysyl-tRNA synthetase class 2